MVTTSRRYQNICTAGAYRTFDSVNVMSVSSTSHLFGHPRHFNNERLAAARDNLALECLYSKSRHRVHCSNCGSISDEKIHKCAKNRADRVHYHNDGKVFFDQDKSFCQVGSLGAYSGPMRESFASFFIKSTFRLIWTKKNPPGLLFEIF